MLYLLLLIAFFACTEWFFNIPFRLYFTELLALGFVLVYFFSRFTKKLVLNKELKNFIVLKWCWVLIVALGSLPVLLHPVSPDSPELFLKGFLQILIHTLFFTAFIWYLSSQPLSKLVLILKFYLSGVVASCIYGIVQVVVLVMYKVDIDMYVWKLFSPSYAASTNGLHKFIYGNFFRLKGWSSEPNLLSSSIITAFPILFAMILFGKKHLKSVQTSIVTATLVLTQSLSGMLGTIVAILTIVVLCFRRLHRISLRYVLLPLLPILIVLYIYSEEALQFASVKLDPHGTSAHHSQIMKDSIMLIANNPIGFGTSNFALAYERAYGEIGFNPHSTWIMYLVEEGWLGLIYQVFFSLYILIVCLRKRSLFSRIFIGSYLGVCVGGIFYETLELFYVNFFVALCFTIIVLLEKEGAIVSNKMDPLLG